MEKLRVEAENGSYDLLSGSGLLAQAGEYFAPWRGKKTVIVTDENVAPLYAKPLAEALEAGGVSAEVIVLPAGERTKNIETLTGLYSRFAALGITRTDCVTALGGGVIGDTAGLAAATYLRGVPLVQAPTSLLAQVDSSVGGKVAVDIPEGKNLVGAFYQPALVLADTDALSTLPRRELLCGMAEVIKYGAIRDEGLFSAIEADPAHIDYGALVARCCAIKAEYVHEDPFDRGVRMELNFGHTLGHAIEKCAGYGVVLHGEGVAIGMVAAAKWGETLGVTEKGTAARLEALLNALHMPCGIPGMLLDEIAESFPDRQPEEALLSAMGNDKKSSGSTVRTVLLARMGKAVLHPVNRAELMGLVRSGE